MEILITGANGFLGRAIVNELSNDFKISSLSRNATDYKVSLDNEIPNFIKKFDFVIHAAGKVHSVPKTAFEKQQFYDINVLGTENLLKGLEKAGLPKQFIFISSVAVYGKENGDDINEEDLLLAKDDYGLSKIRAEKIAIEWCSKHNVICTILRLPLLVGKNPLGNLGAMLKAIDKGYYFNIGGGKARKSMVLAQDVAVFIPKVAAIGGIYNLTDGVHPDFEALSVAISKNKNRRTPFNLPLFTAKLIGYIGDLLGNIAPINSLKIKKITSNLTFDDTKARKQLEWNPQPVLEYLKRNSIG